MSTTVCRQCSADTSLTRFDRLDGEDGGVRISIQGLTALDCANGHKRFLTPDFPLKFVETLLESDNLVSAPPAVEKGFFRKRAHCPDCGQELPGEPSATANAHTDVELAEAAPITVEVVLPLYRCPGCKQETTLPRQGVERGIMQAVANAFRSADIPPG
jgi:hypothetical protein